MAKVNDTNNLPATRGHVRAAVGELVRMTAQSYTIVVSKDDLARLERRMDDKLDTLKDEILHHFGVVAENIHQDVAGANQDEITLIKDKQ